MKSVVVSALVLVYLLLVVESCKGEVIPFGCPLDGGPCDGGPTMCADAAPLGAWPGDDASRPTVPPLKFDKWAGPYLNERGLAWVEQINAWYEEGSAAGLWQDTFRSFDGNHSRLRDFYPQLSRVDASRSYLDACRSVLTPRVTLGVQSLGVRDGKTWAVADYAARMAIRSAHRTGHVNPLQSQSFYAFLYERNFLLVAPAVASYSSSAQDRFRFLSPFFLHSKGASGTDSRLLKPIVFASAALPPALKTRMLQEGLYVPSLLWLFRSQVGDGLRDNTAHQPAYALPEEAYADALQPSPFLDGLILKARNLTHIPPVARVVTHVQARRKGASYSQKPYAESTPYGFFGALRRGETLKIQVDLRQSWIDNGLEIEEYHLQILRGPASIGYLNGERSEAVIEIPWKQAAGDQGLRTDVLLMVNDGRYDSSPAYVSVRHLQQDESDLIGEGLVTANDN